ncbi:conserved hypothetical protein [Leishmania infantum JPCM5]|uniref:Uncharacterized protein n=2 Tax=Leishmania infantum TaxID=5671 RepID=A4I9F8_LEIIN|nr:conserved hypothetical protein [Leishmania infantum JPCM5]CAC9534982.1 hypothetical_protein_-_conserved [Leishmania infantum]CAM71461.1 conserved hypothetical protein [Leishmania infantum JPCM5]SUZ45349.1 hypothetical_protein_-_conserved [Leishmania infantum]|eukprot:XP_001468377.1 conserved hypothetical protein [Leishmania infantum JPCM5]
MRSSSGISDGEVLIRLDTSALESRLNAFTDQWETALKGIRAQVGESAVDLQSVAADVNAIQSFLLSYHDRNMRTALMAHPTEASDGAAESATQGVLDRFVATATESGSTENLLGMVAVARRLLGENAALRASLDSATAALSTHTTSNADLTHEVEQLRQQTTQQSALLQSITLWLRTLGLAIDDGASGASGDGTSLLMSASAESAGDAHSMESVLSRSPLLLSFRQTLLRDLTERLTSVVDQQSKDFHDTVARLEDRLQRGGKGTAYLAGVQSAGAAEDLQETVRSLSNRLKDMDKRVVKRDEFASLMRTKADSLLLPAKADNAALTDLEARLVTRCAELEERCAFADAERSEFRALLRSIIVSQAHPTVAAAPPSLQEASRTNGQVQSKAQARGTLLGEILPAVRDGSSVAAPAPAPPSRDEGVLPRSRGASASQQLYRVLGTSHGSRVHGVTLGSATQTEYAKPLGSVAATQHESLPVKAAPSPRADESVVAIGMTPTQGAYAAFVSEQMTRRHIASLPALPYEKAPSR